MLAAMHRHPVPAAIAVVVHAGRVLLVRRSNPPDQGLWGFPGGHLELGETLFACAERETLEETGVRVAAEAHLTALDVILAGERGRVARHFVLCAVACRYLGGTAQAADDVSEAEWVPVGEVAARARHSSASVAEVTALALARAGGTAGP